MDISWRDCRANHGEATSISPLSAKLGEDTDIVIGGHIKQYISRGSLQVNISTRPMSGTSNYGSCPQTIGAYKVAQGKFYPLVDSARQGEMWCVHPEPTYAAEKFPLISFEHGDTLGGEDVRNSYAELLHLVASSGFVVCCPTMSTGGQENRDKTAIDQATVFEIAKALASNGSLPIRQEGPMGIMGHSTGGMTTMKNSYKDVVARYNIGAAVMYNGDGGWWLQHGDDMRWKDIEPTLPMLFIAGTHDGIEPKDAMPTNYHAILAANPTQPILAAMIATENHFDSVGQHAKLLGGPAVVAFLSYKLKSNDACNEAYKSVLGDQLAAISPTYYDNRLFNMSGPTVHHNWDICEEQLIPLPLDAGSLGWNASCPWRQGNVTFGMKLKLNAVLPAALQHMKIQLRALDSNVGTGSFKETFQCVELGLAYTQDQLFTTMESQQLLV
jgi:hypothetical protein